MFFPYSLLPLRWSEQGSDCENRARVKQITSLTRNVKNDGIQNIYFGLLFFSPFTHTHSTYVHTANPSVCRLLLFLFSVLFSTLSLLFIFIIAFDFDGVSETLRTPHRHIEHFVAIVELEFVSFLDKKKAEHDGKFNQLIFG